MTKQQAALRARAEHTLKDQRRINAELTKLLDWVVRSLGLEVLVRQPGIRVKVERHTLQVDGDTMRGRVALLIHEGFLDAKVEAGKVFGELGRRGFKTAHPNVVKELDELTRMGFLTKAGKWYTTVEAMKRNIQEA